MDHCRFDCSRSPLRAKPATGWMRYVAILAFTLPALFINLSPVGAETIQVEAHREGDVGRVVLAWPAPVEFTASTANDRLTLRFAQPVEADFWAIRRLRRYVGLPVQSPDRQTLTFPLKPGILALAYADGPRVVLDFARGDPEAASAAVPAAAVEPAAPSPAPVPPTGPEAAEDAESAVEVPAVKVDVRAGQHRRFSRLVFDWDKPVGYAVEPGEGTVTLIFDRPARIDPQQLKRKYLKYIQGGRVDQEAQGTRVQLQISPGSEVRDALEGRRVVIDVYQPPPDYVPPPSVAAAANPPDPTSSQPGSPEPIASAQPTQALGEMPGGAATSPASPASVTPATTLAQPGPSNNNSTAPSPPATLRFGWDRPVAAAVFRRGANLWVIFDAPSKQDVAALRQAAGRTVTAIEQRPHGRATVLKLRLPSDLKPSVQRDGLAWILKLEPGALPPGEPIAPITDPGSDDGPRLMLPVAEPGLPLAITDPDAHDRLVVVPLIPLQSRIAQTISYPQFRLPATAQGIVVEPWIETLQVRSLRGGVELSSPEHLALSLPGTASPASASDPAGKRRDAALPPRSDEPPTRLLAPQQWGDGPLAGFAARWQALERAVIDAPNPAAREQARLQLAQLLIGQHFVSEAIGVLTLAATERPDLLADPNFLALRGAAELLAGRNRLAFDDFQRANAIAGAGASSNDEAALWATVAQTALDADVGTSAGKGSTPPLPQVLKDGRWAALLGSYPSAVRVPLTLLLAEAATRADALRVATALTQSVSEDVTSPSERAQLAYLEGLRKQATGDIDAALARFADAARIEPRRGRAQAELARVRLLTRAGRMTAAEGAAALDPVRYAWRGDALEIDVLRELGRLQLQAGDYPAGLRTLKQAASTLPNAPEKAEITQAMAGAFEELYLHGAADRLAPITALSLYEEFKELTPPGDKGDAMIRRLAERLVQMDLLDQAAALLEKQLATMSDSEERAQLGARLAEIRLLDGKPAPALDALARSQSTPLPQPLQRQRALLQARALSKLDRGDEALAVLGQDEGLAAQLLRAQVYRSRGDWGHAAAALRRVVDAARTGDAQPLDEQQARDVLDLAVALSLAGSDPQLARLDDQYGTVMAATPMRDAFRMLAGTVPPPDADAAALGELVEKAMAFRRSLSPAPDTQPSTASPETPPPR